jgi:hypothetical protein
MMKHVALATFAALGLAQTASAEEGLYYGIGLGVGSTMTTSEVVPFYEARATDYSLALTLGYRFATSGPVTFGIEGNLDLMSGNNMADSGLASCTGVSPSWCEVDTALRLRGTMTSDLAGGNHLTTSLGLVVVKGRAESGPGNNVDTTGRGVSVGVAWERDGSPLRVDLNYDAIRSDNQTMYDRDLDMIGLRVSYMF